MYKFIIAICLLLCFASCQEKAKQKQAKTNPVISVSKAKKLVSTYTGRQDTVMYIHRCFVKLDNKTVGENVLISEKVSDPHPLLSVYFIEKDTLIFIPLPAVSGTTPEIKELELELENDKKQLGIWYTRKEKEGAYSYRIALYTFSNGNFLCVLDEPLYFVSALGVVSQPKVMELGKWKHGTPTEVYLLEAEASKEKMQEYMNNGPLLVKKKNGKRQVFLYSYDQKKYLEATK